MREAVKVATPWSLECSSCGKTRGAAGLASVCDCGQPYLVRYASAPPSDVKSLLAERDWTMWRYREWLPLADGEQPVTLGEGGTPLLAAPRLAARHGFSRVWVKDEGANPTRSCIPRVAARASSACGRHSASSSERGGSAGRRRACSACRPRGAPRWSGRSRPGTKPARRGPIRRLSPLGCGCRVRSGTG